VSPITNGPSEESLFAQLLKCKGKLDTFAINCLQEMLSLMAKDDVIARFVFHAAPHCYQISRYSDWIRPYLEYQKSEVERANSYAYFKNKHDAILKSMTYLEKFEEKVVKFREEEKEAYERAK
jgi:transposase